MLLLEKLHCDVNDMQCQKDGGTILTKAVMTREASIAQKLIEVCHDINTRIDNRRGQIVGLPDTVGHVFTALHVAVARPDGEQIVELLLQFGADVNIVPEFDGETTKRCYTVLQMALLARATESIILLLLRNGADPNARGSKFQVSNLRMAVRWSHQRDMTKIVDLLKQHGAREFESEDRINT